ncbi:hypothetical protein CJF31_00003939 [Rutstroemia sp. NJR-2017a BVV2]|nr:hypothetical protein CJF31_00003939 [Rutstroemia sp. NJR-2017a BVV2]
MHRVSPVQQATLLIENTMAGNANRQKLGKRRNLPGQSQPDWLFPAGAGAGGNQTKNDKQHARELLKRRDAGEPPKADLPSHLLDIVGSFLDRNEFMQTSRTLKTERRSRSEAAVESNADNTTLETIYKEWQAFKAEAAAPAVRKASVSSDSSSSDSDSSSDDDAPKAKKAKTAAAASSDDSSSSSSSDSSSDDEGSETKKTEATNDSSSDSSSESSSDSSSDSDSSTHSIAKNIPLPESDSDSSSDSSSDSDSGSDSKKGTKQKTNAGSDTSETLSEGSKKAQSAGSSSDSSNGVNAKSASANSGSRQLSPPLPPMPTANTSKKNNVPFSRIPKDIKVDPRLASNAYVPYDYAEKAHQDLIVTKGKGFTKEKNKKKRGSYRGGYIDVEGKKGIKFED